MGLEVDHSARRLRARTRGGQVVLLTVMGNAGCPVRCSSRSGIWPALAGRDRDLVLLATSAGVPIYALRRLAIYGRWRPLRLSAWGHGSLATLHIAEARHVGADLERWEYVHLSLAEILRRSAACTDRVSGAAGGLAAAYEPPS